MTQNRVNQNRVIPRYEQVRHGAPVSSNVLMDTARAAHTCRGFGVQLVTLTNPMISLSSGSHTMRVKHRPSSVALERVWTIITSGAHAASGTVSINGGTTTTLNPIRFNFAETEITETVTRAGTTVSESTLLFSYVSTAFKVVGVSCREAPRAELELNTTDYGLDLDSLAPRDVIYQQDHESIYGLAQCVKQLSTKRGTLLSQWFQSAFTVSGPGAVDLFSTPIYVLPPRDKSSDTRTSCIVELYGKVTSGSYTITITDRNGATSTATLSSTTDVWTSISKSFLCEDPSQVATAGEPSGGMDTCKITLTRLTGTGTCTINGVAIYV